MASKVVQNLITEGYISSSAPPLQKSGIKILVGEQLENISVYRL